MHMQPQRRVRSQRGITLIGLVFWAIVIAFVALIAMRVFPSVNEYLTLKKAVATIAATNPASPGEVKTAFLKQQNIEYSLGAISPEDLEVTKAGDGKVLIRFAYDKQIELFDPVYLLIKYKGEGKAP